MAAAMWPKPTESANEIRSSNPACELDACLRDTVKLRRAYGECLGSQRRRRTWTAAISHGEPLTGYDPWISEWGNPVVMNHELLVNP